MTGDGADTIRSWPADPIDMPMSMHDDDPVCVSLQPSREPVAVDLGRSYPLGERVRDARVFKDMMMERHDP